MSSYYIVDNNTAVINSLKNIFKDFSAFISHGESSSYDDAMNTILKKKPDIVFINLDGKIENPFALVSELKAYLDSTPSLVAVSSSKKHAYKALKHGFIDYMVTPIPELELRKLILTYKKNKTSKTARTLCLQSYKDFQYVNTDEILFLKADNNTTDFYMNDGTVISAFKTLKTFQGALPNNFLRIHKSYIINKNFISRINYGKHSCTVEKKTLKTPIAQKIPFTKTYMDNINYIKESLSDISVTKLN